MNRKTQSNKDFSMELQKYLIHPTESSYVNYDTVNIFKHPVYQIFFWKNEYDNTFFSVYKYLDKYITIIDLKGDVYDLFNEDTDEDVLQQIIIHLLKSLKIYDTIDDITFKKSTNRILVENFNEFSENLKNRCYV